MKKILTLTLLLAGCTPETSTATSDKLLQEKKVKDCTYNGIMYFRDIGSYPILTNGRIADEVAAERCNRTVTAFPEPTPFCVDYNKRAQTRIHFANNPSLLKTLEKTWAEYDKNYPTCK